MIDKVATIMKFLNKIKNKSKSIFLFLIIRLSLTLKSPWLSAWCLYLAKQPINKKGEYKILCLGRSIFTDDVYALTVFGGHLEYVSIHRTYWRIIFDYFIKDLDRNKITENNYHVDDYGQEHKKNYYLYLSRVIPWLKKILGFDAVLSGNIGYVEQQEIERVCSNQAILFVVLHKEGMGAYNNYADVRAYHDFQFNGSGILFYNEAIAQALIGAKIPGLTKEKSAVVGIPRFDFYFKKGDGAKEKKQVVLFSFHPRDRFFDLIEDKEKAEVARERCELFHKIVIEYALKNPTVKVIIKTKAPRHYLDFVKDIQKKYFKEEIKNLIITNEGSSANLIKNSLVILGFGSTILLEALCVNRSIIILPEMRDLIIDQSWDFFMGYQPIINYAKTEADIELIIKNSFGKEINRQLINKLLAGVIYKPDGLASQRAEAELVKLIKLNKTNLNG